MTRSRILLGVLAGALSLAACKHDPHYYNDTTTAPRRSNDMHRGNTQMLAEPDDNSIPDGGQPEPSAPVSSPTSPTDSPPSAGTPPSPGTPPGPSGSQE